MRFGLRIGGGSKKVKNQLTPSPVLNIINGRRSLDSGSKDEAFFDSRGWLDSDCEEDFFSVNGDFLPSRGSTPNHQSSEPSPTESKKRLLEFLQESQSEEDGTTHQDAKSEKIESNGNGKLSDNSGSDSNIDNRHEDLEHGRDEAIKAKQYCCLPSLVRTLSYRGGGRK